MIATAFGPFIGAAQIHGESGLGGVELPDPAGLPEAGIGLDPRHGVDVIIVQMGKGSGQIPLDKLADHIKKLPNKLSAAKITEVNQRLRALDAMRPKAPIPRGPIQRKGARSAMRGR